VIAQDTGGAIQGALRFDYFWGFGDDAGAAAGRQKSAPSRTTDERKLIDLNLSKSAVRE